MAKTKQQKKEIKQGIEEKINQAKSIFFTSFRGLTVKEIESIRSELNQSESEYYVVKKSLLNLALKNSQFKDINIHNLEGQIAAVFGYNDEIIPVKILAKFKKELNEKVDFLGGILENQYLEKVQVENLANIPSRGELEASLVFTIKSPISGLVNILLGNLRSLVYVLKAIEGSKQKI